MVFLRKADEKDVPRLSKKFLQFLEDKEGKYYQENVTRFGIPEEYLRKALSEETLLNALDSGKVTFYLAIEDNGIIGFAQTIYKDNQIVELDRIVVFPSHERKGVGTQLLKQAIEDERRKGTRTMIVNAGKGETHARRFYEKNGFQLIEETTIDAPWGKKLDLATYQLQLSSL